MLIFASKLVDRSGAGCFFNFRFCDLLSFFYRLEKSWRADGKRSERRGLRRLRLWLFLFSLGAKDEVEGEEKGEDNEDRGIIHCHPEVHRLWLWTLAWQCRL